MRNRQTAFNIEAQATILLNAVRRPPFKTPFWPRGHSLIASTSPLGAAALTDVDGVFRLRDLTRAGSVSHINMLETIASTTNNRIVLFGRRMECGTRDPISSARVLKQSKIVLEMSLVK